MHGKDFIIDWLKSYFLVVTLINVVMYSRRELKVKELVVRKAVQLVLIEVLVLFAAFYDAGEKWLKADIIGKVAISIFVIYVIANLFDWVQNTLSAKRMTEELLQFQQNTETQRKECKHF